MGRRQASRRTRSESPEMELEDKGPGWCLVIKRVQALGSILILCLFSPSELRSFSKLMLHERLVSRFKYGITFLLIHMNPFYVSDLLPTQKRVYLPFIFLSVQN